MIVFLAICILERSRITTQKLGNNAVEETQKKKKTSRRASIIYDCGKINMIDESSIAQVKKLLTQTFLFSSV